MYTDLRCNWEDAGCQRTRMVIRNEVDETPNGNFCRGYVQILRWTEYPVEISFLLYLHILREGGTPKATYVTRLLLTSSPSTGHLHAINHRK